MKYKLIATDLDGTLNNDNYEVSYENVQAIKKAINVGIRVVLCSGRSPSSLHKYEEKLGLNTKGNYGIGFNGSTVYDSYTKKTLFGEVIPQKLSIKILELIKDLSPKTLQAVYIDTNRMVAEHGLEEILAEYNPDGTVKIDYYAKLTKEHITGDVINMYCINYRPKLEPLYQSLKKIDLGNCSMAFTSEHLLEFLPKDINKAQGIVKLCNHLNINMEDVVTVGDNYNDLEMIQESGYGMAVSNAVKPLKEIASYITKHSNNNNAMVEVVDKVIELNKEAIL